MTSAITSSSSRADCFEIRAGFAKESISLSFFRRSSYMSQHTATTTHAYAERQVRSRAAERAMTSREARRLSGYSVRESPWHTQLRKRILPRAATTQDSLRTELPCLTRYTPGARRAAKSRYPAADTESVLPRVSGSPDAEFANFTHHQA